MKLRTITFFALYISIGVCCWKTYFYFFDRKTPQFTVLGIEQEKSYQGTVACQLLCNKNGELRLYLDGHPLESLRYVYKNSNNNRFSIATEKISPGKHTLSVVLVDQTYQRNSMQHTIDFYVDNTPLELSCHNEINECKILQGRTFHVQFKTNKPLDKAYVTLFDRTYDCFPSYKGSLVYETFIPIACEEMPAVHPFTITAHDSVGNNGTQTGKLEVVPYQFKREAMRLSNEKLSLEEELGQEAKVREATLTQAALASIPEKIWRGPFCTPIDIVRISCEFGTVRTTQHKGRYAHKALDVINQPKSVVWAPHDGIVILKDRFSDSGNTVAIDHGRGVISLFYHLDDFAKIDIGDRLVKGNPIGTIGKTGHATGYHLHWEMRVNNIPVEPLEWTTSVF